MRLSTDYIVIHCSATSPEWDIGAAEIRDLHRGYGQVTTGPWVGLMRNGWKDIGYHFVIRRNGKVETGRPQQAVGAHAFGHNNNSIGICLVGGTTAQCIAECNFTRAQWATLENLVYAQKDSWPNATVLGHRDLPGVNKACPSFDAASWWYNR